MEGIGKLNREIKAFFLVEKLSLFFKFSTKQTINYLSVLFLFLITANTFAAGPTYYRYEMKNFTGESGYCPVFERIDSEYTYSSISQAITSGCIKLGQNSYDWRVGAYVGWDFYNGSSYKFYTCKYENLDNSEGAPPTIGLSGTTGACTAVNWVKSHHYHPSCNDGSGIDYYFDPHNQVCVNSATNPKPVAGPGSEKELGAFCPRESKPSTQANPASTVSANPINFATGNKFKREVDYIAESPGILQFVRYYNSGDDHTRSFSSGWRNNYDRSVKLNAAGTIASFTRADGKTFQANLVGSEWQLDLDIEASVTQTTSGWEYVTINGTTEVYDSTGLLTEIRYENGRLTTFNYVSGRLDTVTDDIGNSIQFSYNSLGRITSIQLPDGRNWAYRYDANTNNLAFVDNPDGTSRQHHYENPDFPQYLTGITDERGIRYATYSYDTRGRAKTSYLGIDIEKIDVSYDPGNVRTLTNSRGVTTTYNLIVQNNVSLVSSISGPGCRSCGSSDSNYEYGSANSNLLAKTIKGLRTEYGNYDANSNPGFMIEAAGTTDARTTTYTYDPRFRDKVATQIEPSVCATGNKVTTYDYDDFGNTTSITVDGFKPDCTSISRTTTLQYMEAFNQLTQIDGPRTDVADTIKLAYYPNDPAQGNNRARLKAVTTPLGIVRNNIQYSVTGKILSETRLNGVGVTYVYYPGNDRLQSITESDGITSRTTYWTYLPTGEVELITRGYGSPVATTVTFGYDTARLLTSISDGLGNRITYQLDTEGNQEQQAIYDAQSVLRKLLSQTFDDYNRLNLWSQANENNNSDFAVDGTLDKVTDGKGVVTDYSYDALKRLTTTTQDLGGTDISTQNALTQYGYDAHDNLTSVVDPNNGNTTYLYDDLDNLLSQTSPDTGTSIFTHDAAGNVRTRLDAKGQSITYSYDALNRVSFIDAPSTENDITYTYDNCSNGAGRLCSITIGTATENNTVTYSYDAFGNVISHQNITYTYDVLDRLRTIKYPSGNLLVYRYDAAGQVSQLDLEVNGIITTLASNTRYAPFGPLIAMDYGNGLHLEQPVDDAYRYLSHTIPGVLELTNTNYDANGNLGIITDNIKMGSDNYQYDALNRMSDATGLFGEQSYGYDKNANRTTLTDSTGSINYGYKLNSNRISNIDTTNIVLDASGNTTSDSNHTYTYNAYHQLTGVDNKVVYTYNALGQRDSKQTDGANGLDYAALSAAAQTEADELNQQAITIQQQANDLLAQATQLEVDASVLTQQAQQLRTDAETLQIQIYDLTTQHTQLIQLAAEYQSTYDYYRSLIQEPPADLWQWFLNLIYGWVADYDQYLADATTENADAIGQQITTLQTQQNFLIEQVNQLEQNAAALLSQAVTLREQASALQTQSENLITQANAAQALADEYAVLAQNPPAVQISYQYVYDLNGSLIAESDNGNVSAEYVYLNGRPIAVIKQGNVYYIHTDHLSTPRVVSDQSKAVIWKWTETDPFGAVAANDDPDGDGKRFGFNLRFPGQYYDSETGLHYNYFRYYDPSTGRYITSDPIGLEGGLNTYGYVGGDPINAIDPTGLVKLYGGWCGPSWTGGYRKSYNELDDIEKAAALAPVDGLDQCCQTHDVTYASCREKYPCDSEARKKCFKEADRTLSSCSNNSGNGQSLMFLLMGNPKKRISDYMQDSDPVPGDNAEDCGC